LLDAAGIFCTYVCIRCEEAKRAAFNPMIFTHWYDPDKPDVEFPEPEPPHEF
jgi:hypothetical protein